jgi:hypothetical protein
LSDFRNRGKNLKANQIKALRFDAIFKIGVKISKLIKSKRWRFDAIYRGKNIGVKISNLMKSKLCVLARFSKSV